MTVPLGAIPVPPGAIPAHPGTILDLVHRAWSDGRQPTFANRPMFRFERTEVLGVAIDNGNRAQKGAVFGADGTLHTTVIPAIFRESRTIQGQQETSFEIDGQRFWIGEAAFRESGDALPIGPTAQRLGDERQRWFIVAGIVELLRTAGYAPGTHPIMLGLAVPNTEIVIAVNDRGDESLAVEERARAAISAHLKDKTFTIVRRGEDGSTETWVIRIVTVFPQAQTLGTFYAVTKAPDGTVLFDLNGMTLIDIGGGDLHETEVSVRPRYRLAINRPGDGTIRIARALREKFHKTLLNDALAQHALITREIEMSSRTVDISADVEQLIAAKGQGIIADVIGALRNARKFTTITGGGVIPLNGRLSSVLVLEEKEAGRDYLLMRGELAVSLNVIGTLFGLYFFVGSLRRREQREAGR